MKDNQRNEIERLRKSGMGYAKIAQTLSVSVNTIKAFCRRNGLTGIQAIDGNTSHCIDEHASPCLDNNASPCIDENTSHCIDENMSHRIDMNTSPSTTGTQSKNNNGHTGQIDLISIRNRVNHSVAERAGNVETAGFSAEQAAPQVSFVFAKQENTKAVHDVLGMLLRENCCNE